MLIVAFQEAPALPEYSTIFIFRSNVYSLPGADLARLSNAGGEMIASLDAESDYPEKNHEKGSAELTPQTQSFAPQSCSEGKIVIFNSFKTEEILCRYPSTPHALPS